MKVMPVIPQNSLAFRRRLTNDEEKQLQRITGQAKEVLGNTGNSVLLVHDECLPQAQARNTGVANLLGKDSGEFFDFAKTYFGVNTIEVLPQGEFVRAHSNGLVSAYSYSALGLNDSLINPETLTGPAWRNILTEVEFNSIVEANNAADKYTTVQFDKINSGHSEFQKQMRNAFDRFMALEKNDSLRLEFEAYKTENADWLEPKVIYSILKRQNGGREFEKWNSTLDRNLYNLNYPGTQRQGRVDGLLRQNKTDAEFFRFKQFVAEKHLQEGRAQLHARGLKLLGDMQIGFSPQERWANPAAFLERFYVGANDWKAACLNYLEVTDEDSSAARLLKRKAALNARRYDGIRFDASWLYIMPKMINNETGAIERMYLGDSVLKMMEAEIRRVQGDKFSMENLIHEFKAGREDFSIFNGDMLDSAVAERVTIFDSENLSHSWGNNDYYAKTLGMSADSYILGVGDHTAQPLRQIAEGMNDHVALGGAGGRVVRKDSQALVLAHIFNDSVENLVRPAEFMRAKFADIMSAKHNFIFFMDALGGLSRFDSQGLNGKSNYAYKVVADYKDRYFASLQKDEALNLPDVLARAFEKEGLQNEHKGLYDKLCKFAEILKEQDLSESSGTIKKASKSTGWKAALITGVSVFALGILALAINKKHKEKHSNLY